MLAVFYELDVEISSLDFGSKLLNDSDSKLIRRSVGLTEASRASFGPVLNHGQPDSLIAELEDRQSFHVVSCCMEADFDIGSPSDSGRH